MPPAGRGRRRQPGRSPGIHGTLLDFNTPTVFNAALSFCLNWRGNFRAIAVRVDQATAAPFIKRAAHG